MRWIKVCGVGAGAVVLGILIAYAGPYYQVGPISYLLDSLPIYLVAGGGLVVLVGVAGVSVSFARSPGSTAGGGRARFANLAAPIGLVIAATAILTFLSTSLAGNLLFAGPGPCDYNNAPSPCYAAHPDYYQPMNGGYGWSTPGSRLGMLLLPFSLAAWPAALAGALISLLALAMGTARRRMAIAGLMVGSLLVVVMVVGLLSLWFLGGGD